jgi:hypothetical protein
MKSIAFHPFEIEDTTWPSTPWTRAYDSLREWINREYSSDLRCKLFVSFELLSNGTELQLQVIRLDNLTQAAVQDSNFIDKPNDALWRDVAGWPNPLTLKWTFPDHPVEITIPANPAQDRLQWTIPNPGLPQVPRQHDQEISNKIFTTWSSDRLDLAPPVIRKAISTFQILNPHYQMFFFGHHQVRDYIQTHESTPVLQAYDDLRPIAFKIDLWRLIVIYHEGGVYMDSKLSNLAPLDTFLPKHGGMLSLDLFGKGIASSFFALPPKDPLMRKCIDAIVHNVQTRYYGDNPLTVTGPQLLGKVFSTFTEEEKSRYTMMNFENNGIFYTYNQVPVVANHNAEYRRYLSRPSMHQHYEYLWHRRQLYVGEAETASMPSLDYGKIVYTAIPCLLVAILIFRPRLLNFWR